MNSRCLALCLFVFAAITATAQSTISSDFSVNDDGWMVFSTNSGAATPVTYNATGGNPGGFAAFVTSQPSATAFTFQAPVKFTGNQSVMYGQTLTFDLMQSLAGTDVTAGDVQLTGGGQTLVYVLPSRPGVGTWTSYTVPMTEAGWHVGTPTGTAATKIQMKQALGALATFRIRSKYFSGNTGPYTGSIDNVVVTLPGVITAPAITAVAPLSGLAGSSITISGINFNTTTSQNAVSFGGINGTVVSGSTTQLTVKVPVSARFGRIKVTDLTTGRSAESQKNFTLLFDNNKDFGGRLLPVSFSPGIHIPLDPATNNHAYPTVGDIDGDGLNDIITPEMAASKISVFRNLGTAGTFGAASFAAKVSFPAPVTGKGYSVLADLDGDGKPDYLTGSSNGFSANIGIYRNTSTPGTISFAPVEYMNASSYADGPIAVGDIDGDGRPEIVATFDNSAGGASAYVTISRNLSKPGDIEFADYIDIDMNVLGQSGAVTIGDLDNDGKLDFAIASQFNSTMYIYKNTSTPGSFTFNTPFNVTTTGGINAPALVDIDNDGKLDITWGANALSRITAIRNIYTSGTMSAASFAAPVIFPCVGFAPVTQGFATPGDLNGDGKPDIALPASTSLILFENNATTGVIDAATFLGSHYLQGNSNVGYSGAVIADLDGDGKPEVVVGETSPTATGTPINIVIYHNECFPVPVITAVSPASPSVGDVATIAGDLMQTGAAPPAVTVRYGPVAMPVQSSTMTSTAVTIPAGAKSDRVQLTAHGLTAMSAVAPVVFPTKHIIDATSFTAAAALTIGGNVRNTIAIADFDDDGKADVFAIDGFSNGELFHNTHATAGQPITNASMAKLATPLSAGYAALALDIDGDGKTDINSGYSLFRNISTAGTMIFNNSPVGVVTTATGFTDAVAGDFNLDGKQDIASIGGSASVSLYENIAGQGNFVYTANYQTFSGVVNLARPTSNGGIVAADFDKDGALDIATANASANNVSIYQNLKVKGALTVNSFAAAVNVAASPGPDDITAADFDGDGLVDIAITYNNANTFVSVYRNTSTTGAISFAAPLNFTCDKNGFDIVSQDLDGDGKPELVVIHQTSPGSFTVLQNTGTSGTINFAAAVNYLMPNEKPVAIGFSDVNLDGKPDILMVLTATGVGTNQLAIYENKIASDIITITQQPTDATACTGSTASFTAAASGPPVITYRWQKNSETAPTVFTDLADGNGFSGTGSATLSINTSQATGAQLMRYRARISSTTAPAVFTNDEGLSLSGTAPLAPSVSATSGCVGKTVTLTASGGAAGSFRWYTGATGGTPIANADQASFVTPVLTGATSYFVSVTNGSCESPRTEAKITLSQSCGGNTGNDSNAPVIAPDEAITDIGVPVSISLADLITDPNNDADITTLKIISQPKSGATASIDSDHNLKVDYTGNTFAGIDFVTIEVCDKTGLCTQRALTIDVGGAILVYNGLSPDGNGKNDIWKIEYITSFDDTKINHVTLYNRWGDIVFEVDNYDNASKVFTGKSDGGGDLPAGTYFYKIAFSSSRKTLTGYLSLKRAN